MKKSEEEYLKKVIKGVDKKNSFVDYFLTIGLDLNVIFEDWLYDSNIEQIKQNDRFKPVLINMFPPFEKSIISIDENIINHIFPNGYSPIESHTQPKEKYFSLILDNSYYGIEFPQKYIACLMFYEPFECYFKAYNKYKGYSEINNSPNQSRFYFKEDEKSNLNTNTNINSNMNISISKLVSAETKEDTYTDLSNKKSSDIIIDRGLRDTINTAHTVNNLINISKLENQDQIILENSSNMLKENDYENNSYEPNKASSISSRPSVGHFHTNSLGNSNSNLSTINKLNNNLLENTNMSTLYNNQIEKNAMKNKTIILNKSRLGDDDRFLRLSHSNIKTKFKNFYAPKCICLVSVHPLITEYIKILSLIYKFVMQNNKISKPLEKLIDNLLIEVPLPPRGLYRVEYKLLNEKLLFTQPKMNELPQCSYNFSLIFCLLSVQQIVEIFKYMLLETRIIFFSSNIQYLGPVLHSFIQLLFPLKYSFHYISILPETNFSFLESPSPYVFGINKEFNVNFFKEIDIDDLNFMIVDLDTSKTYFRYKASYYKLSDEKKKSFLAKEFPDLPEHYKEKLISRVNRDADKLLNSIGIGRRNSVLNKNDSYIIKLQNNQSVLGTNIINSVRDHFFQFLVNILQRYPEFLNLNYYTNNELGQPTINNLFHVNEYINIKDARDKYFYIKLIETQMFTDFIMNRMIPNTAKDKLEILLFDENLFKKNNRRLFSTKKDTPFSDTNLYDYKTTFTVNSSSGLSEKDKSQLYSSNYNKELEIRIKLIKMGQDITYHFRNDSFDKMNGLFKGNKKQGKEGKENSETNKVDIYFSYLFFPKLNLDFFHNNLKDYFIPMSVLLSEDVDALNIEMVSKSHLSIVKSLSHEMINNVYICWMQLWALTFWYHDDIEKKTRFQELLHVIDKVYYHEIETFNLIFEVLKLHGLEVMILKLFERLVHLKLNPTNTIRKIVMEQLEKVKINNKNSSNIINYVKENEYKLFPNLEDKLKFRKRSMKVANEWNILMDEVVFDVESTCIECHTKINVDECSRNYVNMKKEILWATCPNDTCKTSFLPKIKVNFGLELRKNNDFKLNTSLNEEIVLYSPAFLKHNYHVGLIKEYHLKLDICQFRAKFNPLFWNSVWFFAIEDLSYDFFIPYEDEVDNLVLLSKTKVINNNEMNNITIVNEKVVYKAKKKIVLNEKENEAKINSNSELLIKSNKVENKSSNITLNNNQSNLNLNNNSNSNDRKINFIPKSSTNNYKFAVKADSNKISSIVNSLDSSNGISNVNNQNKSSSNKKQNKQIISLKNISPLKSFNEKDLNKTNLRSKKIKIELPNNEIYESEINSNRSFFNLKDNKLAKKVIKNSSFSNSINNENKKDIKNDSDQQAEIMDISNDVNSEIQGKCKSTNSVKSSNSCNEEVNKLISPTTSNVTKPNLNLLLNTNTNEEDTQEFNSTPPINKVKLFKTHSFIHQNQNNSKSFANNTSQYISSEELKNYYTGEVEINKGREFISNSFLATENDGDILKYENKINLGRNDKIESILSKDDKEISVNSKLFGIHSTLLFGDQVYKGKVEENN